MSEIGKLCSERLATEYGRDAAKEQNGYQHEAL
jgi:hypothetical protein